MDKDFFFILGRSVLLLVTEYRAFVKGKGFSIGSTAMYGCMEGVVVYLFELETGNLFSGY